MWPWTTKPPAPMACQKCGMKSKTGDSWLVFPRLGGEPALCDACVFEAIMWAKP